MASPTLEVERRAASFGDLSLESRGLGMPMIRGHAAVFNVLSEDLGGFREMIAPGAFATAVNGTDDVRALVNHDPNFILGRNTSKTLRLREDARGLAIEIDLPNTTAARNLVASMKRGDVTQMSFGFSPRPGGQAWSTDDQGQRIRTLKSVRLFDVSPVTFPAYASTDVSVQKA